MRIEAFLTIAQIFVMFIGIFYIGRVLMWAMNWYAFMKDVRRNHVERRR